MDSIESITARAAIARAKHQAKRRAKERTQARGSRLAVLVALIGMINEHGIAWPRRNTLAEEIGVSVSTVNHAVLDLVESGDLIMPRAPWSQHSRKLFFLPRASDLPAELIAEAANHSRDGVDFKTRVARFAEQRARESEELSKNLFADSAKPPPLPDLLSEIDLNPLDPDPDLPAPAREQAPCDVKQEKTHEPISIGTRSESGKSQRPPPLAAYFLIAFQKATGRFPGREEQHAADRVVRNVTRGLSSIEQREEIDAAIRGALDSPDRDRRQPLRVSYLGYDREDWMGHVSRGRIERAPEPVASFGDIRVERERLRQRIALAELMRGEHETNVG